VNPHLHAPLRFTLPRHQRGQCHRFAFLAVLDTENIRDEAMYAFYNMNVSNATLFPGLDGMARSLAYELEFHWAYDPKTMKRYPGY
jgi:hypothetical protein